MAEKDQLFFVPDGRTIVRTVLAAAAMLLLPLLGGVPGALGAMFLGWVFTAALYSAGGVIAMAPIATAAVGCAIVLPDELRWLMLPWAILGAAGVLVTAETWQKQALLWGGASAAFTVIALGALSMRYDGASLAVGLAQELTDIIDAAADRENILISAYQAGLAGLDESYATLPALRIGETVLMLPAVSMQLLYSLRTNLEYILAASMPGLLVSYMAMTALLCTVLPDEVLRRYGLAEQPLPAIETWRLPRRIPGGLILICLLGFLPYLTDNAALATLGMLCSSAADWAFMFTGAGLLGYLMKKRGVSRKMRMITPLVLATAVPQALVILGIVDMFVPLRPRSDADKSRRI